ncbi:YheT family hydrolase [Fangia hongkongensis]|uniref:YheT family hydrolase n=1 Tax=Fangia hongkongensis TaxID=270495 RepID=UPI000371FDE1|nr:alpha/beta fold hydrolase [Fangia hongkongensis]MBK2125763.1 alpha/beta fold hydrolase [Fangia hongkongensis]
MEFQPTFLSAKWQTIIASLLPAGKAPPRYNETLKLPDGDALVLSISTPKARKLEKSATQTGNLKKDKKIVILFHGLCGDAESAYMIRLARKFYHLGVSVIRVNHRGANKKLLPLARNIYHAGKSEDVLCVLRHVASTYPDAALFPVGFSLSGNMLLKALGKYPELNQMHIQKAMAICPSIDLVASINKLLQPENRLFNRYFSQKVYRMYLARLKLHPNAVNHSIRYHRHLSLYDIDNHYTSKEAGHENAESYYQNESAYVYLDQIKLNTLIIADSEDPFIDNSKLLDIQNKHITYEQTKGGGHMGYLGRSQGMKLFYHWMDVRIIKAVMVG